MNKYEVTIKIEGHWGTKYKEKTFFAENDERAEEIAEEILDMIETRYSENAWGAYEEASIDDVVRVG